MQTLVELKNQSLLYSFSSREYFLLAGVMVYDEKGIGLLCPSSIC